MVVEPPPPSGRTCIVIIRFGDYKHLHPRFVGLVEFGRSPFAESAGRHLAVAGRSGNRSIFGGNRYPAAYRGGIIVKG